MMRLGITGGIGSGKSTVAGLLQAHGLALVDADAISRQLTVADGLAIGPIRDAFGPDFIDASGAMDRARMRSASYADPAARKRLEGIIHPLVAHESERQEAAAIGAGVRCLVYDIPLLVESRRWRQKLDRVLVIDCTEDTQILRVLARSGLDRGTVKSIIAAQATRQQRLRAADLVVFNGGDSMSALAHEVTQLTRRLGL